jgi:uncharacterized protein (TIGR01244 family)
MSDFRQLSDTMYASPQISVEDVAAASKLGVILMINNRPEGEEDGQTPGPAIEAAARSAGMQYVAIPVTMDSLSEATVEAMADALGQTSGPILAYCRSGTRSTLLWSLARAKVGADPHAIAEAAKQAGYDVSPVRAAMDAYAAQG